MTIDTSYDFRTDAGGKGPDLHSPTLRRYHQVLWSRALPDGSLFTLETGACGFLRRIADRMDLTLECIRRHYLGLDSPLGTTLGRYRDFFALFEDFSGYVEFFPLQDLVNADGASVRFFQAFDDFRPPSMPSDVTSYRTYSELTVQFIHSRNSRIDALQAQTRASQVS